MFVKPYFLQAVGDFRSLLYWGTMIINIATFVIISLITIIAIGWGIYEITEKRGRGVIILVIILVVYIYYYVLLSYQDYVHIYFLAGGKNNEYNKCNMC
jgi:cation transporter-like permease